MTIGIAIEGLASPDASGKLDVEVTLRARAEGARIAPGAMLQLTITQKRLFRADGRTKDVDLPPRQSQVPADADGAWSTSFHTTTDPGVGELALTIAASAQSADGNSQIGNALGMIPIGNTTYNAPSTQPLALLPAPRLLLGLGSHATVPAPLPSDRAAAVVLVLRSLDAALRTPLDLPWQRTDRRFGGRPPDQLTDADFAGDSAAKKRFVAEESWARMVAEMLTLAPYAGAGDHMRCDASDDPKLLNRMARKEPDPFYPITFACQQLCSVAAAASGLPLTHAIDAGLGTKGTIAGLGGRWHEPAAAPQIGAGAKLTALDGWGPGAVILYANTNRQAGFPHIAFVLRVDRTHHKFQLLDTGAMAVPGRAVGMRHGAGSIYEDPWTDRTFGPDSGKKLPLDPATSQPYRGVGTLPQDPARLESMVPVLRQSRPLGMARLVILEPGSGPPSSRLLFASRLLRMHDDGKNDNYSIVRHLQSLHLAAGTNDLELHWLIYTPRRAFANACLRLDRTAKMKDVVAASGLSASQLLTDLDQLYPVVHLRSRPRAGVDVAFVFSVLSGGVPSLHGEIKLDPKTGPWIDMDRLGTTFGGSAPALPPHFA